MNIYSIPPLISATLFLVFAVFVLVKSKLHSSKVLPFILTCFVTFWWQFTWFLLFNTKSIVLASYLVKIGYSGIIFIPVAFFHFYTTFLDVKRNYRYVYSYYSISVIFLIFLWVSDHFINGFYTYSWGYYPKASILHPLYLLFLTLIAIHCFFSLITSGKRIKWKGIKGNQLKYLTLALSIYSLASSDFIVNYGLDFYPIGFLPILSCLGIHAYAIIKHYLLNIKLIMARIWIFLMVYTFILSISFSMLYYAKSNIIFTIFALILASACPVIYHFFQKKADSILLAKQRKYQKALLKTARMMARQHDLNTLLELITETIKNTVHIEFVGVFLQYEDEEIYTLKMIKGYKQFPRNFIFSVNHPLIKILKKKRKTIGFEQINPALNNKLVKPINSIVPIFMDNILLGFIILGEKMDQTFYTEDDINVFEILSWHAALAIDHYTFMEEFRRVQERIFEAEKLASIGGLAEGVAHQMRNRLNHFSLTFGEFHYETSELIKKNQNMIEQNATFKKYFNYTNDTIDTMVNNLKRSNKTIEGILNFAHIQENEHCFSKFSLQEIIDTSLELNAIKHENIDFPVQIELNSSGLIYGMKAQLLECMYNMLDNCQEAIIKKMNYHLNEDEKKILKPIIKITLTNNDKYSLIEISDNGIGIKEENLKKVFAPFYTTKSSFKEEPGIGMYVVKRIIEKNHHGKIWCESTYLQGTRFFIQLPLQ